MRVSKSGLFVKKFKEIIFEKNIEQPDLRPVYDPKIDPLYIAPEKHVYRWTGKVGKRTDVYALDIDAEFYLDGQSAPKFAWSLGFRPDGCQRFGVYMHDGLYRSKGGKVSPLPKGMNEGIVIKITCNGIPVILGRKACDQIYKAGYMYMAPKKRRKINLAFGILRMFGRLYWGKDNLK